MAIKDGKFIDRKSIKELVEILDEMNLSNSLHQIYLFTAISIICSMSFNIFSGTSP